MRPMLVNVTTPSHELLGQHQALQILVGDLDAPFEHLAEALQLFEDPFPFPTAGISLS
jgi:hypothetical protein